MQSQYRNALILLINCETYLEMLETYCSIKITQLSSNTHRQEQYFTGGVLSGSIRILSLDLFSVRLSPTIVTGIIIVINNHMTEGNSYVSIFLDYYLKENKVKKYN